MKRFYYQFWLSSVGQSRRTAVKSYEVVPTRSTLDRDLEIWMDEFRHLDCVYGWRKINRLPKNRRKMLADYKKACEMARKWGDRKSLLAKLLQHPPYNGTK